MENIVMKILSRRVIRIPCCSRQNHTETKPVYRSNDKNIMDKKKKLHPYQKVHAWKSSQIFCNHILQQVIYNKDGLVGINKPYGISARIRPPDEAVSDNKTSHIPYEVNYTLTDVLPVLAQELGYNSLNIIRTPEKFTSGITLLGVDEKVGEAVAKSLRRAEGNRIIPRTYWTVNRSVPLYTEGERRLAMRLEKSPEIRRPVPVIVEKWGKNERSRGDVKILNAQFKVLSTSSYNLASLVEIKSSTTQWHALRLFASSILLSPVLGDQIYGSRVKSIMGKWVTINPLVEAAHVPPKLEKELLRNLKVQPYKDSMIPVHVHLREMFLPSFIKKGNDVKIIAPLPPSFLWTCEQLGFNEELFAADVKVQHND